MAEVQKKNSRAASYKSYIDPTGEFTSQELGYAFWYVRHKVMLYKILVAGLIFASAVLWIYSGVKWIDYGVSGIALDQRLGVLSATFYDYTGIKQRYSPQPINIISSAAYSGGINKYDAVAEVINPNSRFLARFDYYFTVGDTTTPKESRVLLPGEDSLAVYGGIESGDYPGAANLVITNLRWTRISAHQILDTASWQADRLNFSVTDFSFSRSGQIIGSPDQNVIKFTVKNESAYGYVEPDFYVALYNGQNLSHVLPLHLKSFDSLETKQIDLRSYLQNEAVDSVKLFPKINLYDSSVYSAPPR